LTQICKENQLGSSFLPLPLSFCTNVEETVLSLVQFAWELGTYESSEAGTVTALGNQLKYKLRVWQGESGSSE